MISDEDFFKIVDTLTKTLPNIPVRYIRAHTPMDNIKFSLGESAYGEVWFIKNIDSIIYIIDFVKNNTDIITFRTFNSIDKLIQFIKNDIKDIVRFVLL